MLESKVQMRGSLSQMTAPSSASPSPQTPPLQSVPVASGSLDFSGKMRVLRDAFDKGLITADEYETKRKALLNAL
jgi:hypothetical protein